MIGPRVDMLRLMGTLFFVAAPLGSVFEDHSSADYSKHPLPSMYSINLCGTNWNLTQGHIRHYIYCIHISGKLSFLRCVCYKAGP